MEKRWRRHLRLTVLLIISVISLTVMVSCSPKVIRYEQADQKCGNVLQIDADPQKGFYWPYFLYIPEKCAEISSNMPIWVVPNNTGKPSDDMTRHLKKAERDILSIAFQFRQNDPSAVLLVPVFPRFEKKMGGWKYYTHALDRDSLLISPQKKPAITIHWKGDLLTGTVSYNLDNIFLVQDNSIYRCVAATIKLGDTITEVPEFAVSFVFEAGFDVFRPFNMIEFPREGGFLFQETHLNDAQELVNNICVNDPALQIVHISYATDDDFSALWDNNGGNYMIFDQTPLERLDLQLIAMIHDSREKLKTELQIDTQEQISMFGFSASGMFVDRFCYLHPELVKAAVIGSPGGLPMSPLSHWKGQSLRYPIGLADYSEITEKPFNMEEFKAIHRFVFLGDQDDNDSVPYRDSFDKEDEELVFKLFGNTPVERFPVIKQIFKEQHVDNTIFTLYRDAGHEITLEIYDDVTQFLLQWGQ